MRGKTPRRIEDCPICSNDAFKLDEYKINNRLLRHYECSECGHSFSLYSDGKLWHGDDCELDTYEYMQLNS